MKTRVFIILGGLFGLDGYVTSRGMIGLGNQIKTKFPNADVTYFTWTDWQAVVNVLSPTLKGDKNVVIGYSGGGSRATWLAGQYGTLIDLLITYDPSPQISMRQVRCKAINYHNQAPWMFGLGGGVLVGPNVHTVEISEQHLMVQYDQRLHDMTLAEIGKL
jgi:pimeloyl-ACP methyl ester carboxylesterase